MELERVSYTRVSKRHPVTQKQPFLKPKKDFFVHYYDKIIKKGNNFTFCTFLKNINNTK